MLSLNQRRLTVKKSLLSSAQAHEGADVLRRGEAQDGVYHHLSDPADNHLTLVLMGRGHHLTDLVQQVNHSLLHEYKKKKKKEKEKGERHVSVNVGLELMGSAHLGPLFGNQAIQSLENENAEGAL